MMAPSVDLPMQSNVGEFPLDQDEKRVCSINTMINYYKLTSVKPEKK